MLSINAPRQSVTHSEVMNEVLIAEDYISVYTVCEHSGRISVVVLVGFMVSPWITPGCNRD